MRKLLIAVLGAGVALGALCSAAVAAPVKVGDPMPEFTLVGLDDVKVKFDAALYGKADKTAIVFINTACGACRQEMALVTSVAKKNPGLKVYAVSVDMAGKDAVAPYKAKFGFDVTYVLDPEFKVGPLFDLSYTPGMAVVGKDGKLVGVKSGYNAQKDEDAVIGLLK